MESVEREIKGILLVENIIPGLRVNGLKGLNQSIGGMAELNDFLGCPTVND
jgi:hypothetical protein